MNSGKPGGWNPTREMHKMRPDRPTQPNTFSNARPGGGTLSSGVADQISINSNRPTRPRTPGLRGGGQTTVAGASGIGDAFTQALLDQLSPRDLPDRNPEGNINNALSGIASNESSAGAALTRNAAASGFGAGGGVQGGLQSLYEGFAGQKADTSQGIRNDMENLSNQDRAMEEQRQLQALGIASQRVNQQEALAQQQAMQEAEFAHRLQLASQAKQDSAQDTPNWVNTMQLAGASGGGGGIRPAGPTPQWGGANMLGGGLGGATTTNPNKGVPFAPWRGTNTQGGITQAPGGSGLKTRGNWVQ